MLETDAKKKKNKAAEPIREFHLVHKHRNSAGLREMGQNSQGASGVTISDR